MLGLPSLLSKDQTEDYQIINLPGNNSRYYLTSMLPSLQYAMPQVEGELVEDRPTSRDTAYNITNRGKYPPAPFIII